MSLQELRDEALVESFREHLVLESEVVIHSLEFIAELDRRRLFFHHSSLWSYLVEEFSMEESTAEKRIWASRVLRRVPSLWTSMKTGPLNIGLLEEVMGLVRREALSD